MLLGLLLTLNILVCLALIGVVLLQRSEGGALGGGGSPTGLVTSRGAGDLLTRTTWILFALFLSLSLALTLVGARERSSQSIINRLKLQSINPDSLPTRPAPGATPVSPPTVPAAPKPDARASGAPQRSAGGQDAASSFTAPAPTVSLPPLPGPTKPAQP